MQASLQANILRLRLARSGLLQTISRQSLFCRSTSSLVDTQQTGTRQGNDYHNIKLDSIPGVHHSQGGFLRRYESLVHSNLLQADALQLGAVECLSNLCDELAEYTPAVEAYENQLSAYQEKRESLREELRKKEREEASRKAEKANSGTSWGGLQRMLEMVAGGQQEELNPTQRAVLAARVREEKLDDMMGPPPPRPQPPRGVYIYGSVGSGKSMVMDMFYTYVVEKVPLLRHRRVHFNAAMLEVNMRLHKLDRDREVMDSARMEQYAQQVALHQMRSGQAAAADSLTVKDPVKARQKEAQLAKLAVRRLQRARMSRSHVENSEALARSNAVVLQRVGQALIRGRDGDVEEGWEATRRAAGLLCLDEMQVTDPFAAIALKGVLEALLEEGCVVVATSNRAPWELNRQGLHEDIFEHFTQRLLETTLVRELSVAQDYRRLLARQEGLVAGDRNGLVGYFFPLGPATGAALEAEWQRVARDGRPQAQPAQTLDVMFGRQLQVPVSCGEVARFRFDDLCGRPLGAADYIALASAFHTVFLTDIPAMSFQMKDKARRFITLIDELYNARVQLVCSAECSPDDLFAGAGSGEPVVDLESLQFEGAVEGGKLRRDLLQDGGVAPVAATAQAMLATMRQLGGMEEKFAFSRAISRLHEMQSQVYLQSRPRP